MSKTICFASAKGGSGKTILATTFATFLVAVGKRVLLIDTDASTNGLTLLHLKEVMAHREIAVDAGRRPVGVYEATSDEQAEPVLLTSGVQLIPATYSFQNTDTVDIDQYRGALAEIVHLAKKQYDYIFVDAQAGSDEYAHVALSRHICDEVVIVSEYDPISAAGVERLKALFRDDLTYQRTWILLNKLLPEFVNVFSNFLGVVRYLSPVPWDSDVVRAYARRKVALDLDSGNAHTLAIINTLKHLLGDEILPEIEAWIEQRSTAIREPIEQQYVDIERQLEGLIAQRFQAENAAVRRRAVATIAMLAIPMSILALGIVAFTFTPLRMMFSTINSASMKWVIIVGVSAIGAIIGGTFVNSHLSQFSPDATRDKVMQERFRRRQQELEQHLASLRMLRDADLQTLVAQRKPSL